MLWFVTSRKKLASDNLTAEDSRRHATRCGVVMILSLLSALLVSPTAVTAADIGWYNDIGSYYLFGEITPGDTERLKTLVARNHPWPLHVELDSPGGDVYEAMRLGRFLRQNRATARVTFFRFGRHATKEPHTCASACVLALAGASERFVVGGRVLVHRPSLEIAPVGNLIEAAWRQMSKDVRAYLLDMNVPEALSDLMMRTPPEQAHALTYDELNQFMLSATDPVKEAEDTAAAAELLA